MSTAADVANGMLYLDKSGCGPAKVQDEKKLTPLVIGLIAAGGVCLVIVIITLVFCICCCCITKGTGEGGGGAGHRSKPKTRKNNPAAKYDATNAYMQSQVEGYEIKMDQNPDSLDLEDSNDQRGQEEKIVQDKDKKTQQK